MNRNIATLDFKTETVAETMLRASWIWSTSGSIPGTWGIFSSPRNSKLTPDSLGLYWNGQRKTFWTLSFGLLGPNIAPLYFKTDSVAETVLRASWFWQTLARFPGIWGVFFSSRDSKLTRDGLAFYWNGQRKNIWTLGFELLGRNTTPLHLKTDRVAETALRVSWFLQPLARFPGT